MNSITGRLQEMGVELPQAAAPAANYIPFMLAGNQLFISGQLPMEDGRLAVTGRLGDNVSLAEGQRAARLCAINILAQAQAALGSLSRITRLAKLGGFVNSTPGFSEHHLVINGASDFMAEAMGEIGRHTRFAVGVASLPFDAPVEIDAIFQVHL